MTQTLPAAAPPAPPPTWLRVALTVIAAVETFAAVSDVSNLFADYGHTEPLVIFAQNVARVHLALAPLLAAAALFLAVTNRLRPAIVALAALSLLAWAADLPSLAIHGLEINATVGGAGEFVYRFIYPVIATAAIVLAWRGERLVLAGILASLPTVFAWLGVLAFAVMVSIYGF